MLDLNTSKPEQKHDRIIRLECVNFESVKNFVAKIQSTWKRTPLSESDRPLAVRSQFYLSINVSKWAQSIQWA